MSSCNYRDPSGNDLLSTTRVDDGTWHHIVVTGSGVCSGCLRLYIDGILEDTKDGVSLVDGVDPFIIGGTYSGGGLYPFKGALDEVTAFHRALTTEEVQSMFNAGSAGMCKVQYSLVGFFPPVDNLPALNVVKAGRTIPVKWRLFDGAGAPVSSLASIRSLASTPIACSADPIDASETVDATIRYDGTDNQFICNWKTAKSWSGCRLLQLTLADGAKYYAKFDLK